MGIKFASLLAFLLFLSPIYSQDSTNYRSINKANSIRQIKELHNGILLVRLSAKQNTIEAMQKVGKLELAEKIRLKQRERNLKIVKAFRDHFTFCSVFFFYSSIQLHIWSDQVL